MPYPTSNQPEANRDRPGGIRGWWLVVATLSLFLIVPTATIVVWSLLPEHEVGEENLDWQDRETWFLQSARPRPLEYDKFVQGETGKRYRKTNLVLEPVAEAMLQRLATLAKRDDFFESDSVRDSLIQASADYPQQWYPPYLLASWHKINGNDEQYNRHMAEAFSRTNGAIVQRLTDGQGSPVSGYRLPPVAIGFDRVVDGDRNATLSLVYPAPVSDSDGLVYLPAWWTIYRLTDPQAPAGVEPPTHPRQLTLLPQPMDGPVPNWFSVPPPGIAKLSDAVVE